jgi:Uma2 family endonuclease
VLLAPAADFMYRRIEMSQAPPQPSAVGVLHLSNVAWKEYTRFLRLFAERPGYRLIYDRGELEIMSPLYERGRDAYILGRLVDTLTLELRIPVVAGGVTTIRRRRRQRGLEPDNCYWIANAARVAGLRRIALAVDPPPDLAIEVDVSSRSLDRMSIYARLGVPEVWRLEGDVLTFNLLGPSGDYDPVPTSQSFPMLAPNDLLPFLQQARQGVGSDDNEVIRSFTAWVRQRQAPPAAP